MKTVSVMKNSNRRIPTRKTALTKKASAGGIAYLNAFTTYELWQATVTQARYHTGGFVRLVGELSRASYVETWRYHCVLIFTVHSDNIPGKTQANPDEPIGVRPPICQDALDAKKFLCLWAVTT